MARKPRTIIRKIFRVEDFFPRNTAWRKAPPAWLFQGVCEGLLCHVPAYKQKDLCNLIEVLMNALIWPFEKHPKEKLRWTEKRKQEVVARVIRDLPQRKGMPPDHDRTIFLKHAVVVDDYLKQTPFPFQEPWKPKQEKWLNDHLLNLLKTLRQCRFQCGDGCKKRISAPSQKELEERWQFNRSPTTLIPMILSHYHDVARSTATKQIQPPQAKNHGKRSPHESMSMKEKVMLLRKDLAIQVFHLD